MLSRRQIAWRALGLPSVTPDDQTREEQAFTVVGETLAALAGAVVGAVVYAKIVIPAVPIPFGNLGLYTGWVVIPVIFAMLAWYFFLNSIRMKRSGRIISIYLAHRKCASCGYSLDDLPKADDGCVQCPECQAAWRFDRLGPSSKPSNS